MTCFWDGILNALKDDDWSYIQMNPIIPPKLRPPSNTRNVRAFIAWLKNIAAALHHDIIPISWQSKVLTSKFCTEVFESITNYDINGIGGGHLTSCCDPFMCLICYIFRVCIEHNYNGHMVIYNINDFRKKIYFQSDIGHFSN